jgi:predicted negative regulator of RcsB-dependent stress response
MATLESDDANILDAETINWRLIVYPILAVIIVGVGGFAYYYYQLTQREDLETTAHAALFAAKTPADWLKVADQYPTTDQATLALLNAAEYSFDKQDYAGAIADYQRVLQSTSTSAALRDSAQIGLASSQEANGKTDDAIASYLAVARNGAKSPFAPYAYSTVARLYDERGDKDNEKKILTEAASLDSDSPFVKQAQLKLKELNAAAQPPLTLPAPAK